MIRAFLLSIAALSLATAALSSAAEPGDATAADTARALVTSITPVVETIRGLRFKTPVSVEIADDAVAREHFEDRMRTEWPESRIAIEQAAYTDLGLLPPRTGLKASVLDALKEQTGGYYDPGSNTFYVLGDMPATIGAFIVAHELTHALDDQYFDLDGMIEKAGGDDGRTAGVAAVIEGSGTLVMTLYVAEEIRSGRMKADVARDFQTSDVGQARQLKATPQVVQRELIGPYVLGMNFLLKGDLQRLPRETVPWGDLERAFRDPPVSWEQVLHPEKYWDEKKRDLPRPVVLPDLSATLGEGWALAGDGGLGEMILAILTDPKAEALDPTSFQDPGLWTNAAATGWGGDRWQLYRRGDDTVTVLATVWDSKRDAREFHAALPRRMTRAALAKHDAVVVVTGDTGNRARPLAREALRALRESPLPMGQARLRNSTRVARPGASAAGGRDMVRKGRRRVVIHHESGSLDTRPVK